MAAKVCGLSSGRWIVAVVDSLKGGEGRVERGPRVRERRDLWISMVLGVLGKVKVRRGSSAGTVESFWKWERRRDFLGMRRFL